MKAKTRAEKEAEGEVRGSAQMVSCQRPAVPVCACVYLHMCVRCSYHAYLWMLHKCGVHVCPCFLVCIHACVCVCACLCPLSCGEVLYVRRAVLPRWHWQTDTARLAELARPPSAQLALPATMLSPMYRGREYLLPAA